MRKKIISLIITVCIFFCMSIDAFAVPAVTGGFAGVGNYSYCGYGSPPGHIYVQHFNNGLRQLEKQGLISYSTSYYKTNNNVTTSNCAGTGATTFFAYSGHGIVYNTTSDNALHVNYNSSQQSHSSLGEKRSTAINKLTTSIKFNQKYVILYTCNQLTNSGSTNKANNILKMMNGTRLMFGFASVMYLDSREADAFLINMRTLTIKEAFFNAAKKYQVQREDGDSIVRVVGYKSAINDKLTTTYNYAPNATTSLSNFGILDTVVVTHTGQKI